MSDEATVLFAEFPKAVRGYSPMAVDDFVRQIGDRIEGMQKQLNEQNARCDALKKELETTNRSLAAFSQKETALANALVSIEQRKAVVMIELEKERVEARREDERVHSTALAEAEVIIIVMPITAVLKMFDALI